MENIITLSIGLISRVERNNLDSPTTTHAPQSPPPSSTDSANHALEPYYHVLAQIYASTTPAFI